MSEKHTESDASTTGDIKSAAERAGAAIHDTARKIGARTSELGEQVYEQGARGARYVSRTSKHSRLSPWRSSVQSGSCWAISSAEPRSARAIGVRRMEVS